MPKIAAVALVAFGLSGCAPSVWHRPDGAHDAAAAAQFNADKARCRLMAGSADRGFSAYGKPEFVGAVAGLYVVGTAAQTHNVYMDCMQANGYIPGASPAPMPEFSTIGGEPRGPFRFDAPPTETAASKP
jgi:hypothetical protein